jgi:uncharacterized protein (TIGR03435 family)
MKTTSIAIMVLFCLMIVSSPQWGASHAESQSTATATPLTFEAATIKPYEMIGPGPFRGGGTCHGIDMPNASNDPFGTPLGRCRFTDMTLKMLINVAYNLRIIPGNLDSEILGGPAWANSDKFELEGKAEDPSKTTSDQLRQMLQPLLSERFKLQFHRDPKLISGLVLVISKNGSKLKKATDDEQPGRKQRFEGGESVSEFTKASPSVIASFLATQLKQPVIDRTDLSGLFDFTLKWSPDTVADSTGPSILTALQEQLGLRVETQKISVAVIPIDHAEKPPQH